MAGVVVTTEQVFSGIQKVTFDWLSDAAGAADAVTTEYYTGEIVRAVQKPDGGGTQPTNLYDVVLNDSDGADILHGTGADLVNTGVTNKAAKDGLGTVAASKLTLAVAAAGDSKGGLTIVYIKKP